MPGRRASHASHTANVIGASVFGGILLLLVVYVVVFADCIEGGKLTIMGFACALLAGLAGGFMSGELNLRWAPTSGVGKMLVRGTGGFAAFALVLAWWLMAPPVASCARVYKVRVNVVNEQQEPVDDFEIWTSLDNTRYRASGNWSFDVAEVKRPPDATVVVYATKKTAYLAGQLSVRLADNYDQTLTLILKRDRSARIKGRVLDSKGNPAEGARIHVYGHESEGAVVSRDGRFDLPAHAASGERVQLYAVKDREDLREWYAAGADEVTVQLTPVQ